LQESVTELDGADVVVIEGGIVVVADGLNVVLGQ
jgi:hypothetical protein